MIDISAMKSRRSNLFLSSAKAGKAKVLCHATCQSLNHSTGAAVPSRDRTTTQRLVAPHGLKFRVSRALALTDVHSRSHSLASSMTFTIARVNRNA